MIRRFIYFYGSLNIVLILDPGCECFCNKPYQEVNFETHSSSVHFVNKKYTVRYAHIPCDFISLYLIVLTIAMRLKRANYESH